MKCMRCGEEMRNTIGGCYTCDNCGFGVDDCVLRMSFKNGKKGREIDNIIDGKDLIGTGKITDVTINGESVTTLDGVTKIETDEGLKNKIKDLEKQLAEKDKEIEYKNRVFIEMQTQLGLLQQEYKEGLENTLNQIKEDWKQIALKIIKDTRHQVCEEIREKAQKENRYILDHAKLQTIDGILYTISNYVLDQIEQGENE